MLLRPPDQTPPLANVAESEAVRTFRLEFATQRQVRESPGRGSLRTSVRAWAGRVSGRADRRLLFAVATATDALAERCDALADRLDSRDALMSEVNEVFGVELAQLRAEVVHLRSLAASLEQQRSG